MHQVVVADAGPLIGLARIGRLSLLMALYGPVVVPPAVLAELNLDADRPGSRHLAAAFAQGAIQCLDLASGSEVELHRLGLLLDAGEASAILLAEQIPSRFLLIDERRGMPVVGLAGVLLAAQRSGLLDSVGMALTELSQQGYRLSDALVAEILRLAGEIA